VIPKITVELFMAYTDFHAKSHGFRQGEATQASAPLRSIKKINHSKYRRRYIKYSNKND
jgi:hypothetical protein